METADCAETDLAVKDFKWFKNGRDGDVAH
jgi:hypothetical protein